jgi:hypothetical protein
LLEKPTRCGMARPRNIVRDCDEESFFRDKESIFDRRYPFKR